MIEPAVISAIPSLLNAWLAMTLTQAARQQTETRASAHGVVRPRRGYVVRLDRELGRAELRGVGRCVVRTVLRHPGGQVEVVSVEVRAGFGGAPGGGQGGAAVGLGADLAGGGRIHVAQPGELRHYAIAAGGPVETPDQMLLDRLQSRSARLIERRRLEAAAHLTRCDRALVGRHAAGPRSRSCDECAVAGPVGQWC